MQLNKSKQEEMVKKDGEIAIYLFVWSLGRLNEYSQMKNPFVGFGNLSNLLWIFFYDHKLQLKSMN